jgi:putative ABC transport system ATP-binding protein
MDEALVQSAGLGKSFDGKRWLFKGLQLRIERGEMVSLQGESGSGKSTLLNIIAAIEPASAGHVQVDGVALTGLSDAQSAQLRARSIGFVFQAFHLLPELAVWKNVALPLLLQGKSWGQAQRIVLSALQRVGLGDSANTMPASLSGGEQQRVALLRALIHQPALILADEPTGNLDPSTAQTVLELLRSAVRDSGAALLLVTHSAIAARICDRHLHLGTLGLQEIAAPRDGDEP